VDASRVAKDVKIVSEYNKHIPEYGDVIELNEFLDNCESEFFTDHNGYGHPVKNNLMDDKKSICPSTRHLIPKDTTHICWFNK
jgi:hypothetical protein